MYVYAKALMNIHNTKAITKVSMNNSDALFEYITDEY